MAIAAIWSMYAINRLWQAYLAETVADAISEALRLGLLTLDPAFGARQVVQGHVGGRALRVEWRGGAFGEHTIVTLDGRRRVLPLLTSAEGLRAALEIEPATPAG